MVGDEVTHYYMLTTQAEYLSQPNFFAAKIPTGWGEGTATPVIPIPPLWHYGGALLYRLSGGSFFAVQLYHVSFWLQFLFMSYLLARSLLGSQTRAVVLYMLILATLPVCPHIFCDLLSGHPHDGAGFNGILPASPAAMVLGHFLHGAGNRDEDLGLALCTTLHSLSGRLGIPGPSFRKNALRGHRSDGRSWCLHVGYKLELEAIRPCRFLSCRADPKGLCQNADDLCTKGPGPCHCAPISQRNKP